MYSICKYRNAMSSDIRYASVWTQSTQATVAFLPQLKENVKHVGVQCLVKMNKSLNHL